MKTFKEIRLKKYVLFEDEVQLPLDVSGITIVYGRNLNSGKSSSNASGKTLLFSAIPQIRYDSSPQTSEIKTRAKRDAWDTGTSGELVIEDAGHTYTLSKKVEKKSFKYEIYRDGKAARTRTSDYAKDQFAKVLPWSELEYFTYIHIDSSRPSILRTGSPADRLGFFSEVFHLDSIDTQRRLVKQQLDRIRDQSLIKKEIEQTRQGLLDQLAEIDSTFDEDRATALRDKIVKLNRVLSSQHSKNTELQSVYNVAHAYNRVKKICGATRTDIASWLNTVSSKIKRLEKLLNVSRSWSTYQEALDSYREAVAERKKALGDLLPESWFEEAAGETENKRIYLANSEQLAALKHEVKELRSKIDESVTSDPLPVVADPEADLTIYEKRITKREAKLAHTKKMRKSFTTHFDGDHEASCPVCATTLSQEDQKHLVDAMTEQEDRLSSKIKILQAYVSDLKNSILFRNSKIARTELTLKQRKLDTELVREKASRQILDLRRPVKPTKPDTPAPERSFDDIQQEYDQLKKTKNEAEIVLPIADACSIYLSGDSDISSMIEEVTKSIEETEGMLAKLSGKWTDIEASIKLAKKLKAEVAKLDARIEETELGSEDGDLWEILYDALGNKGLKTLLVQQIAKHLEVGMNRAAPFLLQERTKFEFIVEGVQFHIIATRKVNGKVRSTDVRNLSGAESRAFSFLVAMAMLPLLPAERRANMLILDEPTANMDQPFVDMFCGQFLPKLCNVVPSIVVISPLKLDVPARRVITVTKEGSSSTVSVQMVGGS